MGQTKSSLTLKKTSLDILETFENINSNLEARTVSLEKEVETITCEAANVRDLLSECRAENKGLRAETTVINQLFSQLLMGFNGGNDINIDKLTNVLENHRELLNDITNWETCKDGAAALPKLLFDLVSETELEENKNGTDHPDLTENVTQFTATEKSFSSVQEIIDNLPKVWKVLIELLNHQKAEQVRFVENGENEDCYNSVQTPSGPQLVLSVSKTYIKLKDLILEKNFLQKETHKLKNLNSHLESRLSQQEKRLGAVSVELNKTWSLVGRMQRQHRQLHTHEQVLRYQLQQKRRMLNELKDELEYCRRKWALAREKNDESQSQWNSLRSEFSNRKLIDAQNSAESGYSDDPLSDDETSDSGFSRKRVNDELKSPLTNSGRKPTSRRSTSPVRKSDINFDLYKRGISAPPVTTTVLHDVFETVVEINSTDLNKTATPSNINFDMSYSASSSVVLPSIMQSTEASKTKSEAQPFGYAREQRTTSPYTKEKETKKRDETLEEMFYRISGLEREDINTNIEAGGAINSHIQDDQGDVENAAIHDINSHICDDQGVAENSHIQDDQIPTTQQVDIVVSSEITSTLSSMHNLDFENEQRRNERSARFERLEQQCKQLIIQVMNTSQRGDELNMHLDKVHKKYTRDNPRTDEPICISNENPTDATALENSSTSPSTSNSVQCLSEQEQEYTSRRTARLKRLEEECKAFLDKVNISNLRATEMNTKLGTLHERYGSKKEMNLPSKYTATTEAQGSSSTASPSYKEDLENSITGIEETETKCVDKTLHCELEELLKNTDNADDDSSASAVYTHNEDNTREIEVLTNDTDNADDDSSASEVNAQSEKS